ncbi:nitrogenase-stabilizing/protective protein NifW [Plasticicumulans acidivorans]|uniref:Nitrogenase-stabilizing/protective protein NifW n=1 Tax=Plasticicumulans acidivorans TaxID=886464 RepID=A0A317MQ21_9GAMM|nr:nitrogenase-stabilizing/protective protein NifW [Plasticicumulans acidivorans]PWV58599.1 nitrogenase-stabilizing/protective protein [Plasticicumulans acidivorans]
MVPLADDWQDALEDLSSAEDFLDFFGVPYEPSVVHVNRLHILQRFHDYLGRNPGPEESSAAFVHRQSLLNRAYQDFVESNALKEKVFAVFKKPENPGDGFVSLESLLGTSNLGKPAN